jgi:hypothetical protein
MMSNANNPEVIDITPTWGEWGNVYRRFSESGERKACKALAQDFARACAGFQALQALDLTPEQIQTVDRVMREEMRKQGFAS